ncbi:hypothetical protein BC830DRAFT_1151402 [Chytriomyces sp. MP71]|nr:hypothetical protein BC830DRAFT_1151402 [Chytriomyces sp. MP71]
MQYIKANHIVLAASLTVSVQSVKLVAVSKKYTPKHLIRFRPHCSRVSRIERIVSVAAPHLGFMAQSHGTALS